jgi:hypothetical protein
MPSRRTRTAALAAVLAVGATACVSQPPPTVRITPLQADVVFGVKPKAPPPIPVAVEAPPQQVAQYVPKPPPEYKPVESPVLPVLSSLEPPTPKPSLCPAASLDAFPDQTAPVGISGLPTVGQYRWKRGGQLQFQDGEKQPISALENRLVRRVTQLAALPTDNAGAKNFTFQVVRPGDKKTFIIDSYQVRGDSAAQQRVQLPELGTDVGYVGSSQAGLALVSEDIVSESGSTVPLFHPAAPLQLMPTPIVAGMTFNSQAADPATGRVVEIQAQIPRRGRVDACGTIIEGWLVTGTQTVSDPNGGGSPVTVPFTSIYATQFGALPIGEDTTITAGAVTTHAVNNIGQEKPGPLPPGTA